MPPLQSRTGLLAFITALHLAALWLLVRAANPVAITPPAPLPMVMAEMLPMPVSKPTPVAPQPRPQPQPEPKPRPAPKPKPQQPAPAKPVPRTTDSDKALAEPKPSEQPTQAAAPQPNPAPQATTPPAPPAPPAPLVPPRFNAAYLNNPPPAYPPLMRRAGEQGRVVLRVFVTAEGTAGEVRVLTPSSSPLFDDAALAAVRKWRFVPARRGDTAVAEWVQVPIDFKLN